MWVSSPGKLRIYREAFGEIEDQNDSIPIDLDYNQENSESSSSIFGDYTSDYASRTDDDYP